MVCSKNLFLGVLQILVKKFLKNKEVLDFVKEVFDFAREIFGFATGQTSIKLDVI